jgi:hypothetical protein
MVAYTGNLHARYSINKKQGGLGKCRDMNSRIARPEVGQQQIERDARKRRVR